MKHDEALARTMTPADRAILEDWAAREGPLAEACRAALRDLDALRTKVEVAEANARRCQDLRRRDVNEAREQRDFVAAEAMQLTRKAQGVDCPECGGLGWRRGAGTRNCEDCTACNGSGLRQ
jgi:hypothetical protein